MAKIRYFGGVPLVANLYPDAKKRPGYWRYRFPNGKDTTFQATTPQEANGFAAESNEVREEPPKDIISDDSLPYWAERYIEHREAMDPGLATKPVWRKRNRAAIREFCREFAGTPIYLLSLKKIRPWWDERTASAQRNKKYELNRFCNHLVAEELTPNLPSNAFDVLMTRPPAKKQRQRMTLEAYWSIYQQAEERGMSHVQDAMAIALLTFMRRGDICSLQFKQHTDEQTLWKLISKSASQGKPKRLIWHYDQWPELRKVVNRCRENSIKNNACPYLISRMPERTNKSKEKTHPCQCLPDRLTEDFRECRDSLGSYDSVPLDARPGIHEIRSLGSFLQKKLGKNGKAAMKDAMAHSDEEMTDYYHEGHEIEDIEIGLSELSSEGLGGIF